MFEIVSCSQFRRAQPFYQSRFLPSPDVYQEMKKEVEVRERVRYGEIKDQSPLPLPF